MQTKEEFWKQQKIKVTYKETPIKLWAYFLAETFWTYHSIVQETIKWYSQNIARKKLQLRILYSAELFFKRKAREFIITRDALQEMLKEVLWVKVKGC